VISLAGGIPPILTVKQSKKGEGKSNPLSLARKVDPWAWIEFENKAREDNY